METNVDIKLSDDFDDVIENGDDAIGNGIMDDCLIITQLNQGALKSDVILGPNIIKMINSKTGEADLKKALRLHLERDGKNVKKLNIKDGKFGIEI